VVSSDKAGLRSRHQIYLNSNFLVFNRFLSFFLWLSRPFYQGGYIRFNAAYPLQLKPGCPFPFNVFKMSDVCILITSISAYICLFCAAFVEDGGIMLNSCYVCNSGCSSQSLFSFFSIETHHYQEKAPEESA
jgi:hypothetical protein